MLDIPGRMREEEEYVRATRRGGATGVLWSVVIGGVLAAWLHSSQIALPSDLAEVQPEPALDPAPRAESSRVSYPAGHRLRRRGWVLRRVLLFADAAGFVAAVALVELFRADINFADPAVWAFGLGAFCAWVLFAHGYGLYLNDELQAVRPTADDVPGVILLVTLTTWVGVLVLDASQIATPQLGLTARLLGRRDRAAADGPGDRKGGAEPPLRRARADADRRCGPGRRPRSRGNWVAAPNTDSK